MLDNSLFTSGFLGFALPNFNVQFTTVTTYIIMVNRIFSNRLVQRSFYFFFLILWCIKLLPNALECPKCMSSLGMSYALLFFPVALMLLTQAVINNIVLWRIIFGFFILCSLYFLLDNFRFYDAYHAKMGTNISDFITGELFLVLIVLVVDLVIYKIKPTK